MSFGCETVSWRLSSEETRDALRQALPVGVEIANPLDLRDDASSEHYQRAVNVLLNSQDYDALLGDPLSQPPPRRAPRVPWP
ncbi:protein acetyltransferase [Klebsiella pneumoniae]|uniref:Protein acetyltransferase n=1 Tax=Klebsiella pneumoniae TaxID=573 RepID=A0A447RNZ6_KLEPN|nr:protein acetyltransferase [Klebsiella pneumoniae]